LIGQTTPGRIAALHVETDASTPLVENEKIGIDDGIAAGKRPFSSIIEQVFNICILLAQVLLPFGLDNRKVALVGYEPVGPPYLAVLPPQTSSFPSPAAAIQVLPGIVTGVAAAPRPRVCVWLQRAR
jgi:hypothetical protein